ncbi:MAG: hypothetical protein IIC92_06675 [Chloroflexi bacterium]|nr:hypothetical protein [Chloroflexota bacterium]
MALIRVLMVRCVGAEPLAPDDPRDLEQWCAAGNSARPIQEHVGEQGDIIWINVGKSLCVRFDDGDERVLFQDEVELLTHG